VHAAQVLALPDTDEAETTTADDTDEADADSGDDEMAEADETAISLENVIATGSTVPVTVTITSDALDTPLVIDDLTYSAITDFINVPPGLYNINISANEVTLFTQDVELDPGDLFTTVAYGTGVAEPDYDNSQDFGLAFAPNSAEPAGDDNARLVVVNAYSDQPVTMASLGPNGALDVLDSGGAPFIADPIVARDVPFGAVGEPDTFEEGTYDMRFYIQEGADFVEIAALEDHEIITGTEQTLILAPDYAAAPRNDGTFRPRVLDRDQDELTFATAEAFGSPDQIGLSLFTTYLLPVNLVGFLLLVALIGVIVLTRPTGEKRERRTTRRRKVSRPLVNVISQQTGRDVVTDTPRLDEPESGD
jgi:hypothetical protein